MSNDFSFQTSRGEVLKAMLRHPTNGKLLREAMRSPIGSTSRQKAKKVFSIMNKLHHSYAPDGSGGPGMINSQMNYSQMSATEMEPAPVSAKPMVIFHKIPKPRITYGKKTVKPQPKAPYDGIGGPGAKDGKGGILDGLSFSDSNTLNLFSTPFASSMSSTPTYSPPSTPTSGYPSLSSLTAPSSILTSPLTSAQSTPSWLIPKSAPTPVDLSKVTFGPTTTTNAPLSSLMSPSNLLPSSSPPTAPTITQLNTAIRSGALSVPLVPSTTIRTPTSGGGLTTGPTFDRNVYGLPPLLTLGQTPIKPTVTAPTGAGSTQGSANQPTGTTPTGTTIGAHGAEFVTTTPTAGVPYTTPTSFKDAVRNAIVMNESGGNYQILGTPITTGENAGYTALGKYQIMPNIWFREINLNPDSPADVQKFLNSPELQDKLYNIIMDGLLAKHNGDPGKAAAEYFGGPLGAKNYGTPEGDIQKDGNGTTVNQYVAKFLGNMGDTSSLAGSPTSGSTSGTAPGSSFGSGSTPTGSTPDNYSGLSKAAAEAVGKNTGAGMFALDQLLNPNNKFTGGKTVEEMLAANEKSLWSKYDIEDLQAEEARLREEGALLPKNVVAYITARDQYLVQTDKAIDDFINKSMTSTDMSNPANVAKVNAQLNYLYTLRGRQNQSYIGYLNDAVEQHQAGLDHVSNLYSTALTAYEKELKQADAITVGQYQLYASALADMYTAVEAAPLRALEARLYKAQVLQAETLAITDPTKLNAQGKWLEDLAELKKADFIDSSNGFAIKGTNLVQTIEDYMVGAPQISSQNIIKAYTDGVQKYLNATEQKDATTGAGITGPSKNAMAQEAMQELAKLAVFYGESNPDIALFAEASIGDIARYLGKVETQRIVEKGWAPSLMQAVETLAPGSPWYALPTFGLDITKSPPSEDRFIETVNNLTKDPLSESVARAIYALFQKNIEDDGNKPTSPTYAVKSMLYATKSMSDWDTAPPYTPEQFIQNVYGEDYVERIKTQAFNPQF